MTHHPDDVTDLFCLLESCERQVVDEIKHLIQENLNSVRDPWLLNGLVDYYMATQSPRCLEVLISTREPHDKHLFDKMIECLKNSNRPQTLVLLGHVVRRQPSWLHKIVHHRLMHTLMHVMKTDNDIPNLMNAVLSLVVLLPVVPVTVGPFLPDIFEIFSRLASWNTQKPGGITEVHLLHLRVGIYTLFHRLYAMYPCNFLAYLRQYYGSHDHSRENLRVFTETVRPMLERVRLHPLLVTASKEMELSTNRWKRMETHDIIVECAKLSLDFIEGTREDHPSSPVGQGKPCESATSLPSMVSLPDRDRTLHARSLFPAALVDHSGHLNTEQFSQGSVVASNKVVLPRSEQVPSSALWSPSELCGLNTPPPTQGHSPEILEPNIALNFQEKDLEDHAGSSPPLDVAVEAIPESACMPPKDPSEIIGTNVQVPVVPNLNCATPTSFHNEELSAKDAKTSNSVEQELLENSVLSSEQDSVDQEVSAIVANIPSIVNEPKSHEVRQATPFLSTTHNLTAGLERLIEMGGGEACTEQSKLDDDMDDGCKDDCNKRELQLEFVRSMARIRYRSQCVILPDLSVEVQRKPGLRKMRSCPNINCGDSVAAELQWEIPDTEHMGPFGQDINASLCESRGRKSSISTTDEACVSVCSKVDGNSLPPVVGHAHSVEHPSVGKPSNEHLFQFSFTSGISSINASSSQLSDVCCDLSRTRASLLSNTSVPIVQPVGALPPDIPYFTMLSPHEILDRHLQLGNEVYMQELNLVPLTSTKDTDWTHFGGEPPADEIKILRGQVSLLYSQMLFERYRREVHAQRNRRLLGKAKSIRALEEHTWAMRDQLMLQEKEIHDLNEALHLMQKKLSTAQKQRQQVENNLQDEVRHCMQQIEVMKLVKDKLECSLKAQTDQNGSLQKELENAQAMLFEMSIDLQSAEQGALQQQKLEREVTYLHRKVTLLGEMLKLCQDRTETAPPVRQFEEEIDLLHEASEADIASLKQSLDSKTTQLEACKAKIAELENILASKDLTIAEQKQRLETMKSFHEDQMSCKEKQYNALLNICQLAESHVMKLYHQLDQSVMQKPPPVPSPDSENVSHGILKEHEPSYSTGDCDIGLCSRNNNTKQETCGAVGGWN